jgi:hypothetical protein
MATGTGLCQCGCGQATRISPVTDRHNGWVKGQPRAFVRGHGGAPPKSSVEYLVDPKTQCWVWQRARQSAGYGYIYKNGRAWRAHRWYYEQTHGPIPPGMSLDHLCRNTSCVNPDHLEPVSQQVNSQRGARAKITLEIAREILNSEEPRRVLAERYGISLTTVDHIKTGRVWKNAA